MGLYVSSYGCRSCRVRFLLNRIDVVVHVQRNFVVYVGIITALTSTAASHDALTLSTMLSIAMDLVEGVVGVGGALTSGAGSVGCGC